MVCPVCTWQCRRVPQGPFTGGFAAMSGVLMEDGVGGTRSAVSEDGDRSRGVFPPVRGRLGGGGHRETWRGLSSRALGGRHPPIIPHLVVKFWETALRRKASSIKTIFIVLNEESHILPDPGRQCPPLWSPGDHFGQAGKEVGKQRTAPGYKCNAVKVP